MSLIIDPELHRQFKLATTAQGRQMTDVLVEFIREYVKKYLHAVPPKKRGRS